MTDILIDTGSWVALTDRSEKDHKKCVQWIKSFRGRLFSTDAVLTEVQYLLNFSIEAQSAAIDFVLTGAITIVPSSKENLIKIKELMMKYRDVPMDFADASLVAIANDLGIHHIATFDKKDFGIYRFGRKGCFVILP